MLELVNDILDLSKVEAGKLEFEPSPVHLRKLLQNSVTMVKEKALKRGIRITINTNGAVERIIGDERKLKQILYNVLSNAVKFTPDGGQIKVSAIQRNGDQKPNRNDAIEFQVADTGTGIHPADLQRIFNPFEQVDNTTSRRFQGTGLGLSLSKELVELHGGRIWAESEGEKKGSTFTFVIPTAPVTVTR